MTPHSIPALTNTPVAEQEELELLDQLLEQMRQGKAIDLEHLRARYPEFADSLNGYVDSLQFLNAAASDVTEFCDDGVGARRDGQQLGDYRIVRELGRGGMGIVYEARQISLDRKVALKVLPFAAVLDRKQIARFLIEAHAAAQLHHAHIVPVYAVGQEHGVHYYSMQYIEGQPLERVIEELRSLPTSEASLENASDGSHTSGESVMSLAAFRSTGQRGYIDAAVELVIQAAGALQHAHDLGVVHRDIKPSNLLIDESGKLWIADFGLARCQSDSSLTMTGAVIGTAHYMSPEQAMGRTRLVDHRTDIYSLGITMYELLTLRKASGEKGRSRFPQQLEQSELAPPRRYNRSIPVDLETIVLKAISKRRSRRYATAAHFGDDLSRFLAGKPIAARRRSVADRVGKWANRHRPLMACFALLMVVCFVGSAVFTVLIAKQQSTTRRALLDARLSHSRSLDHFRQARAVVDHFGALSVKKLAAIPGTEELRHEMLQDTLRYYEQFVEQASEDAAMQADLAIAHFKMAEILDQIGTTSESLDAYQQAATLLKQLVSHKQPTNKQRYDLATCYNNIGLLEARRGLSGMALDAYRRALALQTELSEADPENIAYRRSLGVVYGNLGLLYADRDDTDAAHVNYERAVEIQRQLSLICPPNPHLRHDLAMTLNNLSFLYQDTPGPRSLEFNGKAVAILRELTQLPDKVHSNFSSDLALALNNRGALLVREGELETALLSYQQAINISQHLVDSHPEIVKYRRDLGVSLNNQGRVLNGLGRHRKAQSSLLKAKTTFEPLVALRPQDVSIQSSLGGVLNNLALTLALLHELPNAIEAYEGAIVHWQRTAASSLTPDVRSAAEKSYRNLAQLLKRQGRSQRAEAVLENLRQFHQNTNSRSIDLKTAP